jgi:electron transport complex protein RnfC
VVVGPATTALLALDGAANHGPPSPCIRCGWCTDHCPARLNVAALNDDYELALVDRARRTGVAACVDCGVCTYVCPARLPLTQRVRQLKRAARRLPAESTS